MSSRATRRSSAAVALVVTASLGLAACGGKSKKTETPTTSASSSTSASATPSATPTTKPVAKVNPLTGVGPVPSGPVIGVKIDDTANGRPPIGLDQADVVYIEQVEGGLTRMLAVYATNKPVVEPVRSVRRSDSELLLQYGKVILVASGGGGSALPTLDASGLASSINDRGGPGFARDFNRPAPYNLSANLALVSRSIRGAGARSVGFIFANPDSRVAKAPAGLEVNATVGGTAVNFRWVPDQKRYVRFIGGSALRTAAGKAIGANNVLVQFCDVIPDPSDVDVVGNVSNFTATVGRGRIVLFRNGHRIEGRWSRKSKDAPTTFVDASGKPLHFQPGKTQVVLATKGSSV